MSEDQLRRIFQEGEPDWLEQHSKIGVTAEQVIELLDTRSFFRLLNVPYPTDRTGVLGRLLRERLIDRVKDGFAIRRLGGILLANELTEFPDLARKAARVIAYKESSKIGTTIIDRTILKGYAVGFQNLVRFINKYLPQNEIIEDTLRREVKLVPEIAIRELVANALIHQDLTIGGNSVIVEIYSDRLGISNPGEPIVPVERFIDGYQSRNERLADFMRRMGICEERSSGIDRVVSTVVPTSSSRFSREPQTHHRYNRWLERFQRDGPRSADTRVLPTRRLEVGHV
jgi:ATP-dependent DNA helicase RecG